MHDIVKGGGNMAVAEESWTKKYMGEVLGVFVLVFLGNGIEIGLIFSANWPHPLLIGHNAAALQQDPWWVGAGTEIIITAILVITVLGIIEDRIPSAANVAPLAIGIVVAALVGLFAPIEMASLNPARDFGPRLWMLVIGYGSNAIPGPNFNIWVTTLMPLVGGPLGAYIY